VFDYKNHTVSPSACTGKNAKAMKKFIMSKNNFEILSSINPICESLAQDKVNCNNSKFNNLFLSSPYN